MRNHSVTSTPPDWRRRARQEGATFAAGPGRHGRRARGPLAFVAVLALAPRAAAQAVPVPDNLVGWWDAERTSIFDLNAGAWLLDVADPSSCRPRAIFQPVQPVPKAPGMVGEAISFSGTIMTVGPSDPGAPARFDGTDGFTAEYWMKAVAQPVGPLAVLLEKGHDCGSGWAFEGDGVDLAFFVVPPGLGGCPAVAVDTAVLPPQGKPFDGNWHHVAGTYDPAASGQQVRLYVDGALLGVADTQGFPLGVNNRSLQAGDSWQGGRPYFGLLDEISYYARALSAAEIQAIVTAGSAGKIKPPFGPRRKESQRVLPPSGAGFRNQTVAMDGGVVVVGDPRMGAPNGEEGVLNVFRRDLAGTWNHEASLFAPDRDPGQFQVQLGSGVAIQGNEIVAGESESQRVWTYKYRPSHPSGPWVRSLAFRIPAPIFGSLARRIARSGEVVAVGMWAMGFPSYPLEVGGVRIWRRTSVSPDPLVSDTWAEEAFVVSPTQQHEGRFGWSVAAEGDFVLVGAPLLDAPEVDSGAAYVYRFDGAGWVLEAELERTNPGSNGIYAGDTFGASVALSTDSSGRLVALVGAGGVDKCSPPGSTGTSGFEPTGNEGAGYVFVRDAAGSWTLEAELFGADVEKDFYTGGVVDPTIDVGYSAVALDGDVAILGALGGRPVETNGQLQGTAYAFRRVGTSWVECGRFFASDPAIGTRLGLGVAVSGDTAVGVVHINAGAPVVLLPGRLCRDRPRRQTADHHH